MIDNRLQLSLLYAIFLPFMCAATDLKPWFGNEYEAELRASILYQTYDSLASQDHEHFHERDTLATLSAIYPFKRYSGEFEGTGAHTRHQTHCVDNFRVTGRYKWLDDVEDYCSLVTSLTVGAPLSRALHDVSSFHHGHIEGEACISFGQKYGCLCSNDYLFRWWTVAGFGGAEEGSPWYRGDAACEYKYGDVHQFRGFVHSLWGGGNKELHPHHFKGYGSIRHQSVDLGVRYGYIIDGWGTLSFEYARRVYARNFPEKTNLFLFEFYYPFGTQVYTNY